MSDKKVLIYQVEAFKKFDKVTQNYEGVQKIEVMAENEVEALEKAEKMIKANNYMVVGCLERVIPSEFTDQQKDDLVESLKAIAFYFSSVLTHTAGMGGKP